MLNTLRRMGSCFPGNNYSPMENEYASKKDDDADRGMNRVNAWKERFPVTEELKGYAMDHAHFCNSVVTQLCKLPLNYDTIPIIKEHLEALSQPNSLIRNGFLEQLQVMRSKFPSETVKNELAAPLIVITYNPFTHMANP